MFLPFLTDQKKTCSIRNKQKKKKAPFSSIQTPLGHQTTSGTVFGCPVGTPPKPKSPIYGVRFQPSLVMVGLQQPCFPTSFRISFKIAGSAPQRLFEISSGKYPHRCSLQKCPIGTRRFLPNTHHSTILNKAPNCLTECNFPSVTFLVYPPVI